MVVSVSGVGWTWTPLAGSGFGRSARILGVGGGWFVAKMCMMVMGLVRFALMVGHLAKIR